jgi:hypothetical protein
MDFLSEKMEQEKIENRNNKPVESNNITFSEDNTQDIIDDNIGVGVNDKINNDKINFKIKFEIINKKKKTKKKEKEYLHQSNLQNHIDQLYSGNMSYYYYYSIDRIENILRNRLNRSLINVNSNYDYCGMDELFQEEE